MILPVLVSYAFLTPKFIERLGAERHRVRLLVDSGAFSAWNAGKIIRLKDYCGLLEANPGLYWKHFTLDVIGNPVESLANYRAMLERGLEPIPVIQPGAGLDEIDEYRKSAEVIALGGLVRKPNAIPYLHARMRDIGGHKVHWLGFTRHDMLCAHRPHMADASSWESGSRFGSIILYEGNGQLVSVPRKKFRADPHRYLGIVERIGYPDPAVLLKREGWIGGLSAARVVGAASHIAYGQDVLRQLGTQIFLAVTNARAFSALLAGFDIIEKRRQAA